MDSTAVVWSQLNPQRHLSLLKEKKHQTFITFPSICSFSFLPSAALLHQFQAILRQLQLLHGHLHRRRDFVVLDALGARDGGILGQLRFFDGAFELFLLDPAKVFGRSQILPQMSCVVLGCEFQTNFRVVWY